MCVCRSADIAAQAGAGSSRAGWLQHSDISGPGVRQQSSAHTRAAACGQPWQNRPTPDQDAYHIPRCHAPAGVHRDPSGSGDRDEPTPHVQAAVCWQLRQEQPTETGASQTLGWQGSACLHRSPSRCCTRAQAHAAFCPQPGQPNQQGGVQTLRQGFEVCRVRGEPAEWLQTQLRLF